MILQVRAFLHRHMRSLRIFYLSLRSHFVSPFEKRDFTPEEAFEPFSSIAPYPFENFRNARLLQPDLHAMSLVCPHSD